MGKVRVLSAADIRQALPMKEAIEGMKKGFAYLSNGEVTMPLRPRIPLPKEEGVSIFMPGYIEPADALAIKIVSVFPKNVARNLPIIHAGVLALSPETGQVMAMLEGGSLTAIRTGAGAGAATDLLARPESSSLAMIGAGAQARAGIEAVCTVREITEIRVYSRTRANAEAMVAELAGQGPIPENIKIVDSPSDAVKEADIVYAATTSKRPVFDGKDLAPGTHINGVGSFTPEMEEVDVTTVTRSGLIAIDSLEAILEEAGDLLTPMAQGLTQQNDWVELGHIAAGNAPGRSSAEQITFFKSVGVAVQDVVSAGIVLENANKLGIGTEVEF